MFTASMNCSTYNGCQAPGVAVEKIGGLTVALQNTIVLVPANSSYSLSSYGAFPYVVSWLELR